MTTDITLQNLFRPADAPKRSRSQTTDDAARAIVDAEAERRIAKTARLRQARLETEERLAETPAPAKRRRGAAAPAKRPRAPK